MCDRKSSQCRKTGVLTDIEGVYLDPDDKSTLISELTVSKAKALIEAGQYRWRHVTEAEQLY